MMYWGNGMNGWGMALMTMSTLLFTGLVVFGIVWLGRQVGSRPALSAPVQAEPLQILAARYARGEIDDEEYRRRIETLRAPGSSS
jgi:putative membrane protein